MIIKLPTSNSIESTFIRADSISWTSWEQTSHAPRQSTASFSELFCHNAEIVVERHLRARIATRRCQSHGYLSSFELRLLILFGD